MIIRIHEYTLDLLIYKSILRRYSCYSYIFVYSYYLYGRNHSLNQRTYIRRSARTNRESRTVCFVVPFGCDGRRVFKTRDMAQSAGFGAFEGEIKCGSAFDGRGAGGDSRPMACGAD